MGSDNNRSPRHRNWAALPAICCIQLALSFAVAASVGQSRDTSTTSRPAKRSLAEITQEFVASTDAPGVSVAVSLAGHAGSAPGDGIIETACAGVSNKASRRPMRPEDRMPAGSVGKTYVAAVALQLAAEKRVELDAPISKWLGDHDWLSRLPGGGKITPRMLLNHTSGIPEHVQMPEFAAALLKSPEKVWKPEEMLEFVLDKPALFEPGTDWSYADTNYIVLGMIIEKAAGRPFYAELELRILRPLKLKDTTPWEGLEHRGLISGYTDPNNVFRFPAEVAANEKYWMNPQFEWTGGGIITNPAELARWARQLYAGSVLPEAMKKQMLDAKPAKTGPNDRYGLGVQVIQTRAGVIHGHTGWFPGYVTLMGYVPERDVSFALQINTDHGPPSARMRALAAELIEAAGN